MLRSLLRASSNMRSFSALRSPVSAGAPAWARVPSRVVPIVPFHAQGIHSFPAVRATTARAARGPRAPRAPKEDDPGDAEKARKKVALDKALDAINGEYGKGTVMRLGDNTSAKAETFSTGALTLDMALGGGLPRGRIIEVYGPEASGKTSLAVHAMREMQRLGHTVALIDAEHAFDKDFAAKTGLDIANLIFCQPDHGEQALDVAEKLMQHGAAGLIVVDSVSSLIPLSEIQGEMGQAQMGSQARLMSAGMRRLAPVASKSNCTVIFINQLRQKIGVVFGNPEVTSGGNALKYFASVRLDIRKVSQPADKSGADAKGIRCKVKVVKNKIAAPYRVAEFDLLFDSGISHASCVLEAGKNSGVIAASGSWLSYGETKWQGKDQAVRDLTAKPEMLKEIEAAIRLTGTAAVVEEPPSDGEDYEGSEAAIDAEIRAAEEGA